jgi:hypothetical protein
MEEVRYTLDQSPFNTISSVYRIYWISKTQGRAVDNIGLC